MVEWVEVDRVQTPIVLGGSLPLRVVACVVDLIIRYQMDIQHCSVATLTPHFKFRNHYYTLIPEGAEISPTYQTPLLQASFKLLSKEKVKKALDILTMSMSNCSFGGANLMVAACRALAHGYLLTEKNTYGAFNPNDFSILGSYTTEERLQAEQIFKYQSLLEPSESGEITRSPQGDQFESRPPSPPHAIASSSHNPIQPSSPISLDIPPPSPPFRALMSKPILE